MGRSHAQRSFLLRTITSRPRSAADLDSPAALLRSLGEVAARMERARQACRLAWERGQHRRGMQLRQSTSRLERPAARGDEKRNSIFRSSCGLNYNHLLSGCSKKRLPASEVLPSWEACSHLCLRAHVLYILKLFLITFLLLVKQRDNHEAQTLNNFLESGLQLRSSSPVTPMHTSMLPPGIQG